MSAEVREADLAVVGAGPGGYGAAFMAADLGLKTTMIDLEKNPGGTCLYRGCIPSKALLHAAKVVTDAKEAEAYGITFPPPAIDLEKMKGAVNKVVRQLTGGLGQLCKARKIEYIQARANFLDSHTLRLIYASGKEEHLRFEKAILATGSRPAILEQFLIDSPRVMNSTVALETPDFPESMLVIGGGYIGLELGTVYATLGTRLTVVEMAPSLLPGADPDLVKPVAQRMNRLLHNVMLKTTVAEMKEKAGGIEVRFEGENIEKPVQTFEKVLICIGRKPNSSGIGIKSTKVEVDDKSFVQVDEQRRTAAPDIFAIGDLVGNPMLAHKATHEGRVAAEVIAGRKAEFAPRAIPAVVFTDPEIAWAGLTEPEAKAAGQKVRVARFPWSASGRATTLQRPEGLTKIIADEETDQVLGVGICGENAGELISEGVLAIEMGALASDVELTIHPHPTLGETIMESAEIIFGSSTHLYRKGREKSGQK